MENIIYKCYTVGGTVRAFSAQFINAKDIIEIIPTKIGREVELMIVYYNCELGSECSFFCDGIVPYVEPEMVNKQE